MKTYAIGDFEGRELHVRLVNLGDCPGRVHLVASEHDSKRELFAVEAETAEDAVDVLRRPSGGRELGVQTTGLTGRHYDDSLTILSGSSGWRCGYNTTGDYRAAGRPRTPADTRSAGMSLLQRLDAADVEPLDVVTLASLCLEAAKEIRKLRRIGNSLAEV